MRFGDLPIRRKLLLTTLASSATAVVFATGGFLVWDVLQFRREIEADVAAQMQLIADGVSTAVEFRDETVAREKLAALRLRPHAQLACLYDENDVLFEKYQRDQATTCPSEPVLRQQYGWSTLELLQIVTSGGKPVGTLYVRREMGDVQGRLRFAIVILAALLLLSVGAAFLVAARMQRAIASPLLRLAHTARAISTGRDYSLRATPAANDEVGVVVHAFNDMLDRIGERTVELSKANTELQREIEERRRVERERTAALERERDANRLKDEFLATLSHELRTPLNAVLGWTRVLRSAQVEPSTQERALESIERNARAQSRLIEDLLEISRIVTGKLRLRVQNVDLAAIVDAAVEVVRPAAAAKRMRITVEIAARPAMTAGDPDRLQQIVWNLLSNAVKFTPPEGTITVRLERREGYRLSVRDTGPGIDAGFLPFVFEPFRQADGTASREHGGLGLGLAIAKQLVELHGGTIEAHSPGHGQGATFGVHLPSVLAPSLSAITLDPAVAARPADHVDPSLLDDVTVLVVDDEADARVLLETALRQYGARVATAANADEAMAEIDRLRPDVVLSDIGMPNEDGYAFLRRLRARPAAMGGAIPAVAITAYASSQDRRASDAAGFQAHVSKPFEPGEVARIVARLGRATHSQRP
jgi:signal transduction histidine kinase/ActR/RegA family two-component response regulator